MVNDGRTERFWGDVWIELEPLGRLLGSMVEEEHGVFKVGQFWDHNVGWKWWNFAHLLPALKLIEVASVVLRPDCAVPDMFVWEVGSSGCTVRSAYKLRRS